MDIATDLALALSPVALLQRAGLEPDPWQERALLAGSSELYILASRQAGKSTVASALALHAAYALPERTVLLIAPTLRQSSELAAKVRALATRLNLELSSESALRLELSNRSRIIALPGAEGGIRGYSAHLVVLDEAAWIPDALYQAARPMLAVTGGRLVAISTPYGMRGWFYRAWAEERGERIRVTAYDIPRISPEFLEAERRALGDWAFRQEYLAEFIEAGGAIPEELIQRAVQLEGPTPPHTGPGLRCRARPGPAGRLDEPQCARHHRATLPVGSPGALAGRVELYRGAGAGAARALPGPADGGRHRGGRPGV